MKRWFSFISTIVIVGLLVWILKDINFYEVYLLIANANLIWFFLAVLSSAGTFVVWNYKWMYIFKSLVKPDFWFFMYVLLAGTFFNTVTPGAGIGGEPFKAHFIAQKYKKSHAKVLGYVMGDSFYRMVAFFCFIIFSVLFVLTYIKIGSVLTLILELILIFVIIISLTIVYLTLKKLKFNLGAFFRKLHWFKFIKKKFPDQEKFVKYVNGKINLFAGIFRKVVKRKKNIVVGMGLSFVFWILNFLTAYFLFLSFGHNVSLLSIIIVFTLGNIIGSFSPVPGGVGVVEGSMVLLYSAMGVAPGLALLVAFLQRIIFYFFSLFLGGVSLIHLRRSFNGNK